MVKLRGGSGGGELAAGQDLLFLHIVFSLHQLEEMVGPLCFTSEEWGEDGAHSLGCQPSISATLSNIPRNALISLSALGLESRCWVSRAGSGRGAVAAASVCSSEAQGQEALNLFYFKAHLLILVPSWVKLGPDSDWTGAGDHGFVPWLRQFQ